MMLWVAGTGWLRVKSTGRRATYLLTYYLGTYLRKLLNGRRNTEGRKLSTLTRRLCCLLHDLTPTVWARLSLVSVQRLGCWLGLFRTWGRILLSRLDTIVLLKYGKTLLSFVYRLAL